MDNDEHTRKTVRSILSAHGLEQLVGTDIAAIAIPAASAVNVPLLDSAAGYFISNPTATFISQGAHFNRTTGQWDADAGQASATLVILTAGGVTFSSWSGSAGATNITWTQHASIDASGNLTANLVNANALAVAGGSFGAASVGVPGYIRLGAITFIWGQSFITTGTPPVQSVSFVGFPIATSGTLGVTVTPMTTDDSLVWMAVTAFGSTGFTLVTYRTNLLGGTPGALTVNYNYLAVVRT